MLENKVQILKLPDKHGKVEPPIFFGPRTHIEVLFLLLTTKALRLLATITIHAAASVPKREGSHGHSPLQRIRMPQRQQRAVGDRTWMSTKPASRAKLGSGSINPSRSPSIRSKSKTILPNSSVCPVDRVIHSTISPSIVNSRVSERREEVPREATSGPLN